MKKHLLLLFIVLISCTSNIKKEETAATTTYYFIRHSEKVRTDTSNKNPNLNEVGLERAKKWAEYFKNIYKL
jgi:2,3-bisphosphoglycerate-dependent phosphoglycerate mutase